MQRNFLKMATANFDIKLLNVDYNKKQIINLIDLAVNKNVDIINFQELTLTGVSAGELITSSEILKKSKKALLEIRDFTKDKNILVSIGLPINYMGTNLNVLVLIQNGELINIKYKENLSYQENKYFGKLFEGESTFYDESLSAYITNKDMCINDENQLYIKQIFEDDLYDLSTDLNLTNVLLIAGSRPENVYTCDERKTILKSISLRDNKAVVFTGPSINESSTNGVYSGQSFIYEAGKMLDISKPYTSSLLINDINIDELKRKNKTIKTNNTYPVTISVNFKESKYDLIRKLDPHPLIPSNKSEYDKKMKSILEIQAQAIIRRLNQLNEKDIYIGLSGGLDSTLVLLASCLAYQKLGYDLKGIHTITMPGLGTSQRTKSNAILLAESLGVSIEEISIKESVLQHFKDINHDENDTSVVFENAQARERTQILMDLSNKHGGIVIGTGNMSEVALGFATYNGDHISMYGINAGIPKTLLREVVRYVKDNINNEGAKKAMADIIDTPISPELLPPVDGKISQKTEDNVGPYELHDFFIYHIVRNKSSFEDTLEMASIAFANKYDRPTIIKWLQTFLRRFSTQQFKRTCSPDGPGIEDFSLNPRNGLIMASDIDILKLGE